jgi:hypothetical protein
MDRQIQKIESLVIKYLHKSQKDLEKTLGKASKNSDTEIWFYYKHRWGIFKDEIIFIFEEKKVIDIVITEYCFGIEYRNLFYYEGETPEYKISNLI